MHGHSTKALCDSIQVHDNDIMCEMDIYILLKLCTIRMWGEVKCLKEIIPFEV